MRGQLPGMLQPQPRQLSGFSDMQLLQQQYFNKQMQGIQQRQLQQFDQGARQQNSMAQFSQLAKQVTSDQVPTIVNGTPVHDTANYFWSGERAHQNGGDPRMLTGSQLFMLANSNTSRAGSQVLSGFPNTLAHSHDQAHAFRSVGLTASQGVQITHGTSHIGLREASSNDVNTYSSFQWGQENADILSRSTGNQTQKTMMQSNAFVSFQGDQSAPFSGHVFSDEGFASKHFFPGRNVFDQVPHIMQSVNSGITGVNFPQRAPLTRNMHMQEFFGRQENAPWMGNAEEKVPLQEMATLDPVEEKMLYGGDQQVWDVNHGAQPLSNTTGRGDITSAGSFMQGNHFENSDYRSVLPSVQSGSWSALMQSAVAEASSSDTGMQEEWSGLSLHKPELSPGNPTDLNDNGRHSAGWGDTNTHDSLTSRSLHLFDDTTINSNNQKSHGFQQITPNITYDHSGKEEVDVNSGPSVINTDGAYGADRKLPEEVALLEQIPQDRTRAEVALHTPLAHGNTPGGSWRSHAYYQSERVPQRQNMGLDSVSMQSPWAQQRQITFQADGQTDCKLRAWNMNESLISNGQGMQDKEGDVRDPQTNESLVVMHLGRSCDGKMWRTDEQGFLQKNDNQGSLSIPNLSVGFQQQRPSSSPQFRNGDSCVDNDLVATPGSGNISTSNNLYHGQQKTMGSIGTDDTLSDPDGSLSLTRSQKVPMHAMQRNSDTVGSRKFLYHPMGELAMTGHQLSTVKHDLLLQRDQHASTISDNCAATSEKAFVEMDMHNSDTGADVAFMKRISHGYSSTSASSPDGRMAFSSKDKCGTSQNMLELLNKVDHSKEIAGNTFVSSKFNLSPGMSAASFSDNTATTVLGSQSPSLESFALHLAPPAVPMRFFPFQESSRAHSDLNLRDINEDAGKDQAELQHTKFLPQTLQHSCESTHQTCWNDETGSTAIEHDLSTVSNQNMNSSLQPDHMISGLHHTRNELHMSGAGGQALSQDSARADYGSQTGRLKQDNQNPSELLGHKIHSKVAEKVGTVDMSLRGETDFSSDPHFLSIDSSAKKIILPSNVASSYTSSSQLAHTLEPQSVGQVYGQHDVSQQNTSSTMLRNAWFDVSAQRNGSGITQALPRGPGRSVSSEAAWMFQALNDQKLGGKGGAIASEVRPTESQHLSSKDTLNKANSSQHILVDKGMLSGNDTPLDPLEHEPLVSHQNQKNDNEDRLHHEDSQASKLNNLSFQRTPDSASYSLLHQMQARRTRQNDPKNAMHQFGGANDTGVTQPSVKNEQKSLCGYGSSISDIAGTSASGAQNVPYLVASSKSPSCLFPEGKSQKPEPPGTALAANVQDSALAANMQNQDSVALERNKSETHHSGHFMFPARPVVRGSMHSRPEPQMATSWFEQIGTYRNGQFVITADSSTVVQKSPKPVGQQFFFGRPPGSTSQHTTVEQSTLGGSKQFGFVTSMHNSTTTAAQVPPRHTAWQDVNDQPQIPVKRKKRKRPSELLPWTKVVTRTSQILRSISVSELLWAHATNRRTEKFDDEAEIIDDDLLVHGPRKRVIFTTQLMHQIISPPSAAILSAEAMLEYETTIFMLAKQLLGDSCGLLSSTADDFQPNTNNMTSEKIGRSGRLTTQSILKLVKGFLERGRNLETNFLRLEKGPSMLDTRVECQELERFSIINRLARFHGRGGPADGSVAAAAAAAAASVVPSSSTPSAVISSSSDAVAFVPRKIFPQRYVTAVPMPRNLPEGLQCHSL